MANAGLMVSTDLRKAGLVAKATAETEALAWGTWST